MTSSIRAYAASCDERPGRREPGADAAGARPLFYLPDDLGSFSDLFAVEILAMFRDIYQVEHPRWTGILQQLNLLPVLNTRLAALSKGNRRRLLLALALLLPQPVLLLDEPFNGLDLHQTDAAIALLRDLRSTNRTLLQAVFRALT